jgi:hexosaminidase
MKLSRKALMQILRGILPFCFVLSAFAAQQQAPMATPSEQELNLMPMPSHVGRGEGSLIIDGSFSIAFSGHTEDRLDRAAQRFMQQLSARTGLFLPNARSEPGKAKLVVETERGSNEVQAPEEDESYQLAITPAAAKISAPNTLGALHGLETFLQLIELSPNGFAVPAVTINDVPRFAWRGLLIDVSRHFMPIYVLHKNLDGMAAVKMNVLHLHLSDYQGFRVESKKYPKLHESGSDGFYYTQSEIKDLISYARDRGIRIVPEFDMPGHSTAWFVGYPELASAPGPYTIERNFGVLDPAMNPTRDQVYDFLDGFIGEMARLFPDRYFHIGGDEVNGKQWDANPKIQEFKRAHNFKSNEELQAYFTKRVQKIVNKHDKFMIGWDEILTPGMPTDIVIQSWRGPESLAAAAKQGYKGLLSSGYYLDLMFPASTHYAVDPVSGAAAALSVEEKGRILGGEAAMWSEYASPENLDSRIWPRNAAVAERLWSPQQVRDVDSMYRRLGEINWRLDSLGLTHNTSYIPMLQRIANSEDISALRVLADLLEPTKEYTREELAKVPPTTLDPLNRVVDAVRPESQVARHFAAKVQGFVDGKCKDEASKAEIRASLVLWRDNDAKLQPQIARSALLQEISPISKNLSTLSGIALQALDHIETRQASPAAWKAQQVPVFDQAKKATSAQLLLMVVGPLQRLVEASADPVGCAAP